MQNASNHAVIAVNIGEMIGTFACVRALIGVIGFGTVGDWAMTSASRTDTVAAVAAAINILPGLYSIGCECLRKRALSMAASPR